MSATSRWVGNGLRAYPTARPPRRLRRSARAEVEEQAARSARAVGLDDGDGVTIPWPFIHWLVARVVALAFLLGTAWVVYDSASAERFQVQSVRTSGNVLLTQSEVAEVAAVTGANVFWVNRQDVATRIAGIPAVQRVEVEPVFPDIVEVRLVERRPTARWASGGQVYLVDREGVVLMPSRADPSAGTSPEDLLPVVVQVDDTPIGPGARVDVGAIVASQQLAERLQGSGMQPLAFEWSQANGLEVPTTDGWRARFDGASDLGPQVAALSAIRDRLRQVGRTASLIDVRWAERPYYR